MSILIGSIPTIQDDDLELARRILRKEKSTTGSTDILKRNFQEIFQNKDIYLFNRGREALAFALESLDIKNGDEVIVQAMTCIAVVNPILSLKAIPVFVDIDRDNFNISIKDLKEKISNKTKVIIVQHTFGNIADIREVSRIAKEKGIYVIEDCAHIFLTDYSKSVINKYSDISFFSFAQDKSITCTQGGLAVINNKELKEKAKEVFLSVKQQDEKQSIYDVRYIELWSLIKKYYFTPLIPFQKRITVGKVLVILFRILGLIRQQSTEDLEEEVQLREISEIQSTMLLNQLKKCNIFNNHRKEIADLYRKTLEKRFEIKYNENVLLRFPLLVKNPQEVLTKLRENGYICGRWYNTIVFPVKWPNLSCIGYNMGMCINAENYAKEIINLPTSIDVSSEDALKICKIINKYGK